MMQEPRSWRWRRRRYGTIWWLFLLCDVLGREGVLQRSEARLGFVPPCRRLRCHLCRPRVCGHGSGIDSEQARPLSAQESFPQRHAEALFFATPRRQDDDDNEVERQPQPQPQRQVETTLENDVRYHDSTRLLFDRNEVMNHESSRNTFITIRNNVHDNSSPAQFFQQQQEGVVTTSATMMTSMTTTRTTMTTFLEWLLVVSCGTWITSMVFSYLLANIEWVQSWRYTWPFGIGAMYMCLNCGGISIILNDIKTPNNNRCLLDDSTSILLARTIEPLIGTTSFSKAIFFVLGLALVIGGAYDAWMPVYETGPNVVTSAGIGQDAAMGLLGGTLLQMIWIHQPLSTSSSSSSKSWSSLLPTSSTNKDRSDTSPPPRVPLPTVSTPITTLVLYIFLLAQLYKLGEGSFDELFISHFF